MASKSSFKLGISKSMLIFELVFSLTCAYESLKMPLGILSDS